MAINFTDSPADGATQVIGGRTYTYNSAKNKWDTTATEVVGPTATVYATVDNLPGTATTGDQAFVSGTNRLYIWNGSGWYNIALINTNPTISGVSSSYDLATDGTATVITITATDPEGLPITYSLLSDTSGNVATVTQGTGANTNVFTITPSTNNANGGTFSLTFRASDGVNIATAPASFTLQFSVENSNYTTALITSVGANLAVNNTFVDSSTSSHTLTATGNPTQNTFSPYRHGGYSMKTVAGSSLGIPASTDNQFTGDFTIEGWVYSSDVGDKSLYVHGSYFAFNINFGTGFNIYLNSGGASFSPTDIVPASNEWNHVALVRSGSTVSVYLNGVASATTGTNSATLGYNSIAYIGGLGTQSAGSMNAYISDFRVVNGTAVYTSNFTPPTERLTAVTNTSVLACHLPYIADGSTNDKALAANGTITLEPFAPYDSSAAYSASTNGGSIYFDGSSRLEAADSADWNQDTDFTMEAWFYPTSIPAQYVHMFGQWQSGGGGNRNTQLTLDPSGRVFMTVNRSGTNYSTPVGTTLKINNWYHVAVTLSGTTLTVWVNGENDGSTTVGGSSNDSAMGWAIGGEPGSGSYPFTGSIAETRVIKGTALYTTAFTPPTAPLTAIANTKLLLSGTDAGIIDKSQTATSVELFGDTKSATDQTKYLSSSIYFDGNGDYLKLPSSGNFLAQGAWTQEMWLRLAGTGAGQQIGPAFGGGAGAWNSSNGHQWLVFTHGSGFLVQYYGTNNSYNTITIASSAPFTANTWHHWAISWDGTTLRFFLDGTLEHSTTSFIPNTMTSTHTELGRMPDNSYYSQAHYSDVRITKGLARYTANFTPPAAALQG
jgi:hypothetical protein